MTINAPVGSPDNNDHPTFFNALYGDFEGDLPLTLNHDAVSTRDLDYINQNAGALRACAANGVQLFFLIGVEDDTERDAWRNCRMTPSVVLWKDGTSNYVWALSAPVPQDDPRVGRLMERFGMERSDSVPIASPDGWECVHADPEIFYTLEELAKYYLEEIPEPVEEAFTGDTYNDARIVTPYNENDYKGRMITVSLGANQYSKNWKPQTLPLAGLIHQFTKHQIGPKDGLAVVFADMAPGQRTKKAIIACTSIGLDIDTGTPSAEVDKTLVKLGCLAIRTTTHSHGSRSSEVAKDQVLKLFPDSDEVTTEMVQEYLRQKKHWEEYIVKTVKIVEQDHTANGIVFRISHDAMPKHRVIVPLLHPYVIDNEGRTQLEAIAKWAKVPAALATMLKVPFDRSCTDPSRLFYTPRHAKDRPFEISLFGGPLFDLKDLKLEGEFDAVAAEFDQFAKGKSKSQTERGKKLGPWHKKYAHGCQIMDIIEDHAPDKKRSKASGGYNIECPNDASHSNAGDPNDQACFAVNAAEGGNEFCLVKCQHGGCKEYTTLDMIGLMLENEWFDEGLLTDPNYNIAEIDEEEEQKNSAKAGEKLIDDIVAAASPPSITAMKDFIKRLAALEDEIAILSGIEALKRLAGSSYSTKKIEGLIAQARKPESAEKLRAGFDSQGKRLFSYHGEMDVEEVTEAVIAQMLNWNEADPKKGRFGRKPRFTSNLDAITSMTEHKGRPHFNQRKERAFWASLPKVFLTQKITDNGGAGPKKNVTKDIGATIFYTAWQSLPPQPALVSSPFLSPAGELISEQGWHEELAGVPNGVYLDLGDLNMPPLSEKPSPEDLGYALGWLHLCIEEFYFCDLHSDGSYSRTASRANAYAMLFTPFVRRYLRSTAPLFFIHKPVPNTGASLLSLVATMIYEGIKIPSSDYPGDDAEMQKLLTAKCIEGRSAVRFDNVREFNSLPIIKALTDPVIEGRVLGLSAIHSRENNFLWLATGIKPVLDSEISRRVCLIRLDPMVSDTKTLKFSKDLYQWIPENRSNLVWAILTVINHWRSLGRPESRATLSSFEHWAAVIGGILETIGIDGFLTNKMEASPESEEHELKECAITIFRKYGLNVEVDRDELGTFCVDAELPLVRGVDRAERIRSARKMINLVSDRAFDLDGRGDVRLVRKTDTDGRRSYFWSRIKNA